jgi:hypothetical protein
LRRGAGGHPPSPRAICARGLHPPTEPAVRLALPCGGVQAGGAAPRQRWKGQKQNYPGKPCGEHPGRSLPRSGKKVRVLRPLSAGVAHRCERAAAVSPPAILRASAAASGACRVLAFDYYQKDRDGRYNERRQRDGRCKEDRPDRRCNEDRQDGRYNERRDWRYMWDRRDRRCNGRHSWVGGRHSWVGGRFSWVGGRFSWVGGRFSVAERLFGSGFRRRSFFWVWFSVAERFFGSGFR